MPIVDPIFRINDAYVSLAGTEGKNLGAISIGAGAFTAGVPATKYETILINTNISASAKYTVPGSHSLLLSNPSITMDVFKTFIIGQFIKPSTNHVFKRNRAYFSSPTVGPNYDVPVLVSEKSELQWRVNSMGAATDVLLNQSAGLVKNNFFHDQNLR